MSASSLDLRKNWFLKGQKWFGEGQSLVCYCLLLQRCTNFEQQATYQHGGTHDMSCPCALRVSLVSLQKRRRRRYLSAAMGSLALVAQSPLPSLGTSLTCFLLARAELQGSEEWRNGKLNSQVTAGAPEWQKGYPRVSTQIRGQALLHQGPLSPGPSLWSFHQCCVDLTLKVWERKAFFSHQVWSREGRAAADTAASHISWKGAAKPGCVKPHPGCPLICCYMEWKIWKRISG